MYTRVFISRVAHSSRQGQAGDRRLTTSSPRSANTVRAVTMENRGDDVHPHMSHVLFGSKTIAARVQEMAAELNEDYKEKSPLIVMVMCGAFVFASDLVRAMAPAPEGTAVDCVRASSYGGGTSSSGRVQLSGLVCSCKGRHVLLVEDIVDTGRTLAALKAAVLEEGAASVRVATLLDKQSRRVNGERPDYAGFACPDEFVVGFGLDYDGKYRELPYIGVLSPAFVSSSPEPKN